MLIVDRGGCVDQYLVRLAAEGSTRPEVHDVGVGSAVEVDEDDAVVGSHEVSRWTNPSHVATRRRSPVESHVAEGNAAWTRRSL